MEKPQDRLEIDSRLTELSRVPPWIDAVADWHGIHEDMRFAVQLCIEEALANVVLHGYNNQPGHPIVIRSWSSGDALFFAIEDNAPPFAPTLPLSPHGEKPPALESIKPGENGIRLLQRFAGSLAYERLSDGNRLTIGFPVSH